MMKDDIEEINRRHREPFEEPERVRRTILITKVEYLEVEDPHKIPNRYRRSDLVPVKYNGERDWKEASVVMEYARGQRFIRASDNLDLTVYAFADEMGIIGLEYEVLDNLKEANERLNDELYTTRLKLDCKEIECKSYSDYLTVVRQVGFWQRLKWVFTGVKVAE